MCAPTRCWQTATAPGGVHAGQGVRDVHPADQPHAHLPKVHRHRPCLQARPGMFTRLINLMLTCPKFIDTARVYKLAQVRYHATSHSRGPVC
eukprot:861795-Prorocentrum_minimum.AAC.2